VKPPRYKYPTAPLKGRHYTHRCERCGAERVSTVNPESSRAPKICAACYKAEQDRFMSGWLQRKPTTRGPKQAG
jgi:transcription elongation factor Elf1